MREREERKQRSGEAAAEEAAKERAAIIDDFFASPEVPRSNGRRSTHSYSAPEPMGYMLFKTLFHSTLGSTTQHKDTKYCGSLTNT